MKEIAKEGVGSRPYPARFALVPSVPSTEMYRTLMICKPPGVPDLDGSNSARLTPAPPTHPHILYELPCSGSWLVWLQDGLYITEVVPPNAPMRKLGFRATGIMIMIRI